MTVEAHIQEYVTDDPTRKHARVSEHVKRILTHLTPTPDAIGLQETPSRVSRMWLEELTAGYHVDIESLFRLFPDEGYKGMVVVKEIPVTSVCEHHLVPIVGYAHVAYFPDGQVIGLSKLPRVVEAFSRRLQIQERLTRDVHDAIQKHLKPRGTMIVVEAEHLCMTVRGVQAPGTRTVTSEASGLFTSDGGQKDEFFRLIERNH
ncbi:MAG: GTP cyclohydrolase I FolE [Actinobacteria bacterium]|nr:GTP cyclohydrolase I FolE [Actinomycetota bacterium]